MFTLIVLLALAALAFVFRHKIVAFFKGEVPKLEAEAKAEFATSKPAPSPAPAPATGAASPTAPPKA